MKVHADEALTFDMYFASVVTMQMHPGAGTKDHVKLTLSECGDVACTMIEIRRNIVADEEN